MSVKFMFLLAIENPKKLIEPLKNLDVTLEQVDCDCYYYLENSSKVEFSKFLQNFDLTKTQKDSVVKLAFEFEGESFSLTYTDKINEGFDFFNYFFIGLQFNMAKNVSKLTDYQIKIFVKLFDLLNIDFAWVTADDYLNGNMLNTKRNPLDDSQSLTYYVNEKYIKNIPQAKIEKLKSVKSNNGAIYYDSFTDFEYDRNFVEFKNLLRIEFENYQK